MSGSLKITFLGSGPSAGVPLLGCECKVCKSPNLRNNRLRSSILVQYHESINSNSQDAKAYITSKNEIPEYPISHKSLTSDELLLESPFPGKSDFIERGILIDASPDFRIQAIRHNITRLDAVLFTHEHADHIFGIDDLRLVNFLMKKQFCLYATSRVLKKIQSCFGYALNPNRKYEVGAPPELLTSPIEAFHAVPLFGKEVVPLLLDHGSLPILGFRIDRFAYCTDCSKIPDETKPFLANLDVLILEGLRPRPHPTHYSIAEAIAAIEELQPKRAILTHCGHDLDYEQTNQLLKHASSIPIEMAYDGMVLTL